MTLESVVHGWSIVLDDSYSFLILPKTLVLVFLKIKKGLSFTLTLRIKYIYIDFIIKKNAYIIVFLHLVLSNQSKLKQTI